MLILNRCTGYHNYIIVLYMTRKKAFPGTEIPTYILKEFRTIHRKEEDLSNFGYNNLDKTKVIDGFELFSSAGLRPAIGPLKSAFYRISITISGNVDVYLGLEHFHHEPGTVSFTFPNQVFSKGNITADAFGYYILFNPDFLNELVLNVEKEFPFFDYSGTPFFHLSAEEIQNVEQFVLKMNDELHEAKGGNGKAIKMYLYLLLLEMKRSYERQQLHIVKNMEDGYYLISRFKKLVSRNFLTKRKVVEYAELLGITPNHLNRMVREVTGKTASESITEMLLQESKALLKYTDSSISEISYQLDFSDPAAFNRFFKKLTGETPMSFRGNAVLS